MPANRATVQKKCGFPCSGVYPPDEQSVAGLAKHQHEGNHERHREANVLERLDFAEAQDPEAQQRRARGQQDRTMCAAGEFAGLPRKIE